jgi:hypothetical protein
VKLDHGLAAGTLVQAIDVLSDDGQLWNETGKRHQRMMSGIRLRAGNQFTAPAIPAPDQRRVASKCVRRRELVRIVLFPQPGLRFAESRNTGLRRDPRTRQHTDVACVT